MQDLDAGDSVQDVISFTASDGSIQQVTVNINGVDDGSVIGGTSVATLTEDSNSATGTLTISDVDSDDAPVFADVVNTIGDNSYGSFSLVNGVWTYSLDQATVQDLDVGDSVQDVISFTASDGSVQQVTVNINGANDDSVIGGTSVATITEDSSSATGILTISDVDADDAPSFADVANTLGDNFYGSFSLVNGVWSYALDQATVQNLDSGDSVQDTINFTASDGSTQQVTVNINGANDGSVIGGTSVTTLTEDSSSATGILTISDVDSDDAPIFADIANTLGDNSYGSFSLVNGVWTYALNQATVQNLDAGDSVQDVISFTASDGSIQQVTVNINGVDDGSVIGGTSVATITEDSSSATGTLTISDVDSDDAPVFADVANTIGDNGYGSFSLVNGVWTYALNQATVQDLDAEDSVQDVISFTASDGSIQEVTVNINGVDDGSVIGGTSVATIMEDSVNATGTLTISDVDSDDVPVFADAANTIGDNGYGSFSLVNGAWTYSLDQATVQNLDAGDSVQDVISFTASDGSIQQVTVNINGVDDGSVIGGTSVATITEDSGSATGILTISDVDSDDAPIFADVANTLGDNSYGSFSLVNGVWSYALNQATVQNLDAGDSVQDVINFTASDGSIQQVTVNINGANDDSVIGGSSVATLTEDSSSATGTLTISDVDSDDAPIFADVANTIGDNSYGSFSLVNGVWTYSLDQATVQDLDVGDSVQDVISFTASDGSIQRVTVNINGVDDGSVIGGTSVATITEDSVNATGTLTISDVDSDDVPVFSDVVNALGDNSYGSFSLVNGVWTYSLDQATVQDLDVGDSVQDVISFTASDGSIQQVTVNINGVDDGSVIGGTSVATLTEDSVNASGALTISDVDFDDAPVFADVANMAGENGYGSFSLVNGVWTYSLDQATVQDLDAGDSVQDVISFTASDGSVQQVTVNINGANDDSVIGGTSVATLTEDSSSVTGTLTISDVDSDDAPVFADVANTAGENGYGSFSLVNGVWTYSLDQAAVQDLDAGDSVQDVISFTASDGSIQQVTVNINGVDDGSVIGGTSVATITEDSSSATGTLTISDVDSDDTPVFADVANTIGDNSYGSFSLVNGVWTYSLDQAAVQDLDAGDSVQDVISFTASDGSIQQVTVNINGVDDGSVIGGTSVATLTEDSSSATGTLTISDVDSDDAPIFADVVNTIGDNGYGSFSLVNGVWIIH